MALLTSQCRHNEAQTLTLIEEGSDPLHLIISSKEKLGPMFEPIVCAEDGVAESIELAIRRENVAIVAHAQRQALFTIKENEY